MSKPILLYRERGNQQLVVRSCLTSRRAGVRTGMTVTHARALVGNAEIARFEAKSDLTLLRAIARWASRYTPLSGLCCEFNSEDLDSVHQQLHSGITLDITGSLRLFGGEDVLVQTLQEQLRSFSLTPSIAVAPTVGTAWALARFGGKTLTQIDQNIQPHIKTLPTRALRIDSLSREKLAEVGITEIQQLLQISPGALLDRFGLPLLMRIRQLVGHEDEIIMPVREVHQPHLLHTFSEPIGELATIASVTQKLLIHLLRTLEEKHELVRSLVLIYQRAQTTPAQIRLSLSAPSAAFDYLWPLLLPRLEKLNLGEGILSISLRLLRQSRADTRASSFLDSAQEMDHSTTTTRLLDHLLNGFGGEISRERISKLQLLNSHLPERSFRFSSDPLKTDADFFRAQILIRPSTLFERPLAVKTIALLPDKPPSQVQWRERSFRVVSGIGPERIRGEWWRGDHPDEIRDYFRVQLESGTWIWIYRRVSPLSVPSKAAQTQWFIHGVWA